mgnify:CR=1 FL=1
MTATSRCQRRLKRSLPLPHQIICHQGLLKDVLRCQKRLRSHRNLGPKTSKVRGAVVTHEIIEGVTPISRRQQRTRRPTPMDDEVWARVIENDTKTNVIVALGESKMMLGRYSSRSPDTAVGERIYVGVDSNKRNAVGEILGMAKLDRLSNSASSDLPLIAQMFVEENQAHFIKAFFNIAGPLSLKQHAFELLPGIGKKKALQMVEIRGSSGFSSLDQLDEACSIDSAELLAKRFVAEIQDKELQPRLSELLLPVSS